MEVEEVVVEEVREEEMEEVVVKEVVKEEMGQWAERRFRCPSHVVWGFCWNLDTCDRFPESPHRACHESSLGCGIPLRLHLQIAALVLKMERVYNFFTNGIASIAQVGSKNQAQPTRPIACISDLTSFDRSQPTPKMPQT
jgi:hypothetical protein